MRKVIFAIFITMTLTSQCWAQAVTGPAWGTFSSATGGKANAGKAGTNTIEIIGATFSTSGGKPRMHVGPSVDVRSAGVKGDGITVNSYADLWAKVAAGTAKTVLFPEGTYVGAMAIPSGVTVQCMPGAILTIPNSANVDVVTFASGGSGQAITGCRIDGNGANQSSTSRGIYGVALASPVIENNEINNTRSDGIRLQDGNTTPHINRNKIHDVGANGIWILGAATDVEIDFNTFTNWGTVNANADAVSLVSDNANPVIVGVKMNFNTFNAVSSTLFAAETVGLVSGLEVIGNDSYGSYCGFSMQAINSSIALNKFHDGIGNQRSGLEVVMVNSVVLGNTIANGQIAVTSAAYGLSSNGVHISKNVIANQGVSATGIAIAGTVAGYPVRNITVDHNTVNMTGATAAFNGIFLGVYGTTGVINGAIVSNNTVITTGGTRNGIRLDAGAGSTDINIQHNTVSGFGYGMLVGATSNHDQVTVAFNDLKDNGTPISNLSTGGVYRLYGNITLSAQTTLDLGTSSFATMLVTSNGSSTVPSLGFSTVGTLGAQSGFKQGTDSSIGVILGGRTNFQFLGGAAGTPGSFSFSPAATATASNNYIPAGLQLYSSYWNGSAAASDLWTAGIAMGSGTNPASTFVVNRQSGSSGATKLSFQVANDPKWTVDGSGFIYNKAGSDVASASSITPSGPIFHVTGTTTVNTINLPYAGYSGCLKIVPSGIFSTGTSGNIALASTAVVSKVLEMCYDGTKWCPSY